MGKQLTSFQIPGEGYLIPRSVDSKVIGLINRFLDVNGRRVSAGKFLNELMMISDKEGLEIELGFTQNPVFRLHPDSGSQDYIANGEVVFNGNVPAKTVYKIERDDELGYAITKLE